MDPRTVLPAARGGAPTLRAASRMFPMLPALVFLLAGACASAPGTAPRAIPPATIAR